MRDQILVAVKLKDQLSGELKKATTSVNSFVGSLKKIAVATAAAGAAIISLKKVAGVVKDLATAATKQEEVDSQLAAAIRQVGLDVSSTLPKLKALASELQAVTSYGDETIEMMEALLLRYGVAPSELEGVIRAIMDYARVTGKDLRSATMDFGKAISGNVSLLQEYGITVDKAAVESRGAAAVIEAVLKKFGGAEEAFANTTQGVLIRLKNVIGDLKESLGKGILTPGLRAAFELLIDKLKEVGKWLENNTDIIRSLGNVVARVIARVIAYLPVVYEVLKGFYNDISALVKVVKNLFEIIGSGIAAIGAAAEAVAKGNFKGAMEVMKAYAEDVREGIEEIGEALKGLGTWSVEELPEKLERARKNAEQYAKQIQDAAQQHKQQAETFEKQLRTLKRVDSLTANMLRRGPAQIEMIEFATETVKKLFKQMFRITEQARESYEEMAIKIYMKYGAAFRFMYSEFSGILHGLTDEISGFLAGTKDKFTITFKQIARQVYQTLINVFIKLATAKIVASVIDLFSGVPGTGKFFVQSVGLPAFQSGGYVTRPTLALVGEKEPEYIIPQSKFPRPEVHVTIHNANPDTYAEVLVKMSPEKMDKLVREGIKPALEREAIL